MGRGTGARGGGAGSLPLYGQVMWIAFPITIGIVNSLIQAASDETVGLGLRAIISLHLFIYVDITKFIFIS